MKEGDEITLPDRLRDSNFNRIGGLKAKVLKIREHSIRVELLGLKTTLNIPTINF